MNLFDLFNKKDTKDLDIEISSLEEESINEKNDGTFVSSINLINSSIYDIKIDIEGLNENVASGYNGKITIFDKEKQIEYFADFRLIRRKNEVLIPGGGTINWLINCHERGDGMDGYREHIVSEIIISDESRVTISDYTQPSKDGEKDFFTSITFYKKELDKHSIYAPHIYERSYSIYYPYGTRFDIKMLKKIGYALSQLINDARDINYAKTNELKSIYNKQKQLIELLINGTDDRMAVEKIMGTQEIFVDGHIREANTPKDWLPYFTRGLFEDVYELERYKVLKK